MNRSSETGAADDVALELTFAFDARHLSGKPHEYSPRLAVWSTDRQRMDGARPGMAAEWVELSRSADDPNWMTSKMTLHMSGSLPIARDPLAELCVIVQAQSLSDGHHIKPEMATRPYHIQVGQVNMQWYGMLSHLDANNINVVEVDAPVQSLCGFEAVVGAHDFDAEKSKSDAEIFVKRAEADVTRGTLKVAVNYLGPRGHLKKAVSLASMGCPGGQSPTAYTKQCEAAYAKGLETYLAEYKRMFPDALGRPFVRRRETSSAYDGFLIQNDAPITDDEADVTQDAFVFPPDTKNMRRFHLPTWSTGTDHVPFVAWWLQGLKRPHDSDASTEAYFCVHADVGLHRAGITRNELIKTVSAAFSPETSPETRLKYATPGSAEHARFIRSIEATCHAITALQVTCDYATDGRYTNHGERIQTESPQRDALAGLSRLLDCEDDEMTGSIQVHLIAKMLGPEGMERPWNDAGLNAMVKILEYMAPMNNFGSVRGAKLADGSVPDTKKPENTDRSGSEWGSTTMTPIQRNLASEQKWRGKHDFAPVNARLYFLEVFAERHPEMFAAATHMLDKTPELSAMWRQLLPTSDRSMFWRRAYHWIEHYLDHRMRQVVEQRARNQLSLNGVQIGRDRISFVDNAGKQTTLSFDEFFSTYFPSVEDPWREPVFANTDPLDEFGYAADRYSGDYTKYPRFTSMVPLFSIALVFWTFVDTTSDVPDAKETGSLWDLTVVFSRGRNMVTSKVSPKMFESLLGSLVDKVNAMPTPALPAPETTEADEDEEVRGGNNVEVMHQQPLFVVGDGVSSSRGVRSGTKAGEVFSACQQHHVPHWHGTALKGSMITDSTYARATLAKLCQPSRRVIATCKTVKDVRVWLGNKANEHHAEVVADVRSHPTTFWNCVLCKTDPGWVLRHELMKTAMMAHGHDVMIRHHWRARLRQFGPVRVCRNLAMWVAWYAKRVAATGLPAAWGNASSRQERHKRVHRFLDEGKTCTVSRRRPAKRIIKAMLDSWLLSRNPALGRNCHFVNRLFSYVVKAYGALGWAPKPLMGDRDARLETRTVCGTLVYGTIKPKPPKTFCATLDVMRNQTVSKVAEAMEKELPGSSDIFVAIGNELLKVSGDHTDKAWKRLAVLVQLFRVVRLEYLVARVALRGEQQLVLSLKPEQITVRTQEKSVALSVQEFCHSNYQAGHVLAVTFSPAERLAFFVRCKRRLPAQLAGVMMALEVIVSRVSDESLYDPIFDAPKRVILRLVTPTESTGEFPPLKTEETRAVVASGMDLTDTPDAPLVGAEIGDEESMGIAEFARVDSDAMELYLRSNSYLATLEAENPLLFWLSVLQYQFPAFHEKLVSRVVGEDRSMANLDAQLQALGLPDRNDRRWRYAYLWFDFYMSEKWRLKSLDQGGFGFGPDDGGLFEFEFVSPEPIRVLPSFRRLGLNRFLHSGTGQVVTLAEALTQSGSFGSLADYMREGIFVSTDDYASPDVTGRVLVMSPVVEHLYSDDPLTDYRTDFSAFGRNILQQPLAPPRGSFQNPAEDPFITSAVHVGERPSASGEKERPIASDVMLIDNRADAEMDIGGHMFLTFVPLAHLDGMYQKSREMMDAIYPDGQGPHVALHRHVKKLAVDMAGGAMASRAAKRAARKLLDVMPVGIGEGTGRQQILMLALNHYFPEDSNEFMERAARHVAEAYALEYWNRTIASDDKRLEADVYSFQSHLFEDTMFREDSKSGARYPVRLTPFYRRVGHSCSSKLHDIHPAFSHLVWVRPGRKTFGANLRSLMEGNDALPLPAPESLRESYVKSDQCMTALELRARRLAPISLRFGSSASKVGQNVTSAANLSTAGLPGEIGVARVYTSFQDRESDNTRNWMDVGDVVSTTSSGDHDGFGTDTGGHRCIVFQVPKGTRLAKAVRAAAERQGGRERNTYETTVSSAFFVNESPDAPPHSALFKHAASHFGTFNVDRETLLPTTNSVYRCEFTARVQFHIA